MVPTLYGQVFYLFRPLYEKSTPNRPETGLVVPFISVGKVFTFMEKWGQNQAQIKFFCHFLEFLDHCFT